jgi:DNA (cytosine-5)-methyltransferase 1
MRHGSLFSGIGGFDLAAQWCGWENVFQCEIDPFCRRVLRYHFPNAKLYEDITKSNFQEYQGQIDVVSGGFPCQPFSQVGQRKGTADHRFLWKEMLRAIREIQPRWVVAENVYGLVSQESGMVLESILIDLEDQGYDAQSFVVPACAVNAPHQRNRLWIVANRADSRIESLRLQRSAETVGIGLASDTNSVGLSARTQTQQQISDIAERVPNWNAFPVEQPILRRDDGFSSRLDGITFSAWNRESIKAYGNAIVPQIAYQIFKTIDEVENNLTN